VFFDGNLPLPIAQKKHTLPRSRMPLGRMIHKG